MMPLVTDDPVSYGGVTTTKASTKIGPRALHPKVDLRMKAVVCEHARLDLADLPAIRPGHGQVLLQVLRCGICGSDLHARHHGDDLAEVLTRNRLHGLHAL